MPHAVISSIVLSIYFQKNINLPPECSSNVIMEQEFEDDDSPTLPSPLNIAANEIVTVRQAAANSAVKLCTCMYTVL